MRSAISAEASGPASPRGADRAVRPARPNRDGVPDRPYILQEPGDRSGHRPEAGHLRRPAVRRRPSPHSRSSRRAVELGRGCIARRTRSASFGSMRFAANGRVPRSARMSNFGRPLSGGSAREVENFDLGKVDRRATRNSTDRGRWACWISIENRRIKTDPDLHASAFAEPSARIGTNGADCPVRRA